MYSLILNNLKKKFQVVSKQALVLIDLFLKWELFCDFLKTNQLQKKLLRFLINSLFKRKNFLSES
jgi:hypothetical protein